MSAVKHGLEGRPVRSPLHPALVHLPVALLPFSLVLDIASWISDRWQATLTQGATVILGAGIGTALLAALFGFVDYSSIRRDHPARRTATRHMVLNLLAVALFAGSFALRWGRLIEGGTPPGPLLLSLAGVALISYSGYLGGHLVYSDGVAVGRHRRRTDLPDETVVVRDRPGALVAVGDEQALKDGQTLRVEANGVALVIVRAEQRLWAVQDYCTHRFAPLSEGAIRDCELVCPWHRSAFDVRTGQVTRGPAKVDLRTFDVEVRSGKIWLRVPPAPGEQPAA